MLQGNDSSEIDGSEKGTLSQQRVKSEKKSESILRERGLIRQVRLGTSGVLKTINNKCSVCHATTVKWEPLLTC